VALDCSIHVPWIKSVTPFQINKENVIFLFQNIFLLSARAAPSSLFSLYHPSSRSSVHLARPARQGGKKESVDWLKTIRQEERQKVNK